MSNHPNEQELFTLRALAEQAQNPNADVQNIMHHLQSNMEAVNVLQQQIGSLQAIVHDQAQTQAQDPNGADTTPVVSLTAAIQALAAQQLEQQRHQQEYQSSIQLILDRLSHRGASSRPHVPMPLTPKYKGDDGDMSFAEFKSKLTTSFARFSDSLHTDQEKINYALQSMEGPPAVYFAPYVNGEAEDLDGFLVSFPTFLATMDSMYGDQHHADEVNHKLARIRQTGPMSEYISKFRTLSARSGWNEPALLARFKEGLSDDVKSLLTAQLHALTSLRDAQAAATTAYQNHQARARTQRATSRTQVSFPNWPRRNHAPASTSSAAAPAPSAPSAGPMDLDHMRVKHITAEEKQRRREKNLCLYCGGNNHFAGECPVKKARLAAVTIDSENESA